jgi:hypothetical protein
MVNLDHFWRPVPVLVPRFPSKSGLMNKHIVKPSKSGLLNEQTYRETYREHIREHIVKHIGSIRVNDSFLLPWYPPKSGLIHKHIVKHVGRGTVFHFYCPGTRLSPD